jgi:DNA-binding CsgD family transcriptional regulator
VRQSHQNNGARPSLSEREREVLKLVAEGYASREIASVLGISPKTVEKHRANLLEKLDIRTTAGLVRYAVKQGLID